MEGRKDKKGKMPTVVQENKVLNRDLQKFIPNVMKDVYKNFCTDCPRKQMGAPACFPCGSARVMIRVYLADLIEGIARWN